jgi:hypothetical protein
MSRQSTSIICDVPVIDRTIDNLHVSGDGGFLYPSTQRHYRRLILLLNTTYTAACFGRMTIFTQKIYIIR